MPELPDIEAYLAALGPLLKDQPLQRIVVHSPHLLRTVEPPPEAAEGSPVRLLQRLGKRVAIGFANDIHFIMHLMIAGRLLWQQRPPQRPGKQVVAQFRFLHGTLLLTEAGSRKRSSLHVVRGAQAAAGFHPGGIEILQSNRDSFRDSLQRENHTLKRALTDQRLFSGIGNAYSDEILHAARLSPLQLTSRLSEEDMTGLFEAATRILREWTAQLTNDARRRFPRRGEVTAFREGFAVHGRFGKPCPTCGSKVQRIRYAANETNYCPQCQTHGRILADRSLSRLLGHDWPPTQDGAAAGDP